MIVSSRLVSHPKNLIFARIKLTLHASDDPVTRGNAVPTF
jgi:hypothetical protein